MINFIKKIVRMWENRGIRYLVTAYKYDQNGQISKVEHCSESSKKDMLMCKTSAPKDYIDNVLLVEEFDRLDIHKFKRGRHESYTCFVKDGDKVTEL